MKNIFKKFSALLMAAVMVMSLMTMAQAADSTIVIKGKNNKENSVEWLNYDGFVEGDLFENFKEIMPGDVLTQTVFITNEWRSWDYIRLYIDGLLHDEEGNPISAAVLEELTADERRDMETELEYMHDFLAQLTLTVENGGKVIYEGAPCNLEDGFEGSPVYLGRVNYGKTVQLDITLEVPATLGNEYANRIGEVDWVFTYSGKDVPKDDPEEPEVPVDPVDPPEVPDEPLVPVDPPEVPSEPVDPNIPQTGDMTNVMPYVILLVIGFAGLILPLFKRKKDSQR